MDRLLYLKRGKSLLKSVVSQRQWLLKHDKGYVPGEFCRSEIRNIEYALGTIVSSDQMQKYLQRKEAEIRFLIPSKNKKRRQELEELIQTNFQ